jgi:hypothetical protein
MIAICGSLQILLLGGGGGHTRAEHKESTVAT